jgi:Tfp pilus assembly protein PilZ
MLEKRSFKRIPCEYEASFTLLGADPHPSLWDAIVRDLSEGGLRFRTNQFISLREKILFALLIPKTKPLRMIVVPAWISELPSLSQFDIGAKFEMVSQEDAATLRDLVEKARGARLAQPALKNA